MRSGKMYPPRPFFPAVAAEELELVPESRELLASASASLLLAVVVVGVSIWLEAEEEEEEGGEWEEPREASWSSLR